MPTHTQISALVVISFGHYENLKFLISTLLAAFFPRIDDIV